MNIESMSASTGLSRRRLIGATGVAMTPALLGVPRMSPAAAIGLKTDTAPVPPNAVGPAIPPKGYLVQELGEDLYSITDGVYQMMFLVTKDGVVAVDAPPTLGNNILRAIKDVTRQPVRHAVYSHAHADHVGAMTLFDEATFYSHVDVMHVLRQAGDKNRPVPKKKNTFEKKMALNVGGERLNLEYKGPNHAPGNLFVYAPKQRVLMLVDVIFPGWVPFAYLAVSHDIPGWITAHEKALDFPFKTYVGGHLTRLGTRDDVRVQQEYITDLRKRTEYELSNVDFEQIYATNDASNPWAIFDAYLDAVATQASDYLEPRWVTRLGGADVFLKSHVFTMAEALRLDYGKLGPFGIRL